MEARAAELATSGGIGPRVCFFELVTGGGIGPGVFLFPLNMGCHFDLKILFLSGFNVSASISFSMFTDSRPFPHFISRVFSSQFGELPGPIPG
jgi:hypothetical protein